MGLKGPLPKSADRRILEGEAAHRPLPGPRKHVYPAGAPDRPKGMTAQARRVWDEYMDRLAPLGFLRMVDVFALRRLCEDVAELQELRVGMRKMATARAAELRRNLKTVEEDISVALVAGENAKTVALQEMRADILRERQQSPMAVLNMSAGGRKLTVTINSLASRISRLEMQFGLTPMSGQRLETVAPTPLPLGGMPAETSIDTALCM